MDFKLQKLVKKHNDIIEIVKEVTHAFPGHVWQDVVIAFGGWFEGVFVKAFIEGEHATVKTFKRIIRVGRSIERGTATGQ